MLLERAPQPIPVVERLVGLQAQQAQAPYIGLWTRVADFQRDDLAHLIDSRQMVKATWIRATLHLLTAADYLRFRTTLQPALEGASASIAKRRGGDFDLDRVLTAARAFIAETPRSFAEITAMLEALLPDVDVGSMRYTVRTHIPMVQVPTDTRWSYPGNPQFTLADSWIGRSVSSDADFRALFFRYLAAFGPASAADMQSWSGLAKLKDAVEALKPELVVYRNEQNREIFDLPDLPLPDEATPAPVRFLPEYDNLLLSHAKRTRVIADAHRSKVYLPGLRVAATILVDGFVAGTWTVVKKKGVTALTITPFDSLTPQGRAALSDEAERLVRFIEADSKAYEIHFAE
ncbi:MAG: winged helix DNA-binding domain-containing protein [Chloroflexi bacterium]|nr:winged helix DNA-binding domain-containing protein [Chloroflexota bacterium]